MPVPVGVRSAPPVEPVATLDVPSAWWIDPFGTRWPLTDWATRPWFTRPGVKGINAVAPVQLTEDPVPSGGTSVRTIVADGRDIVWPLYIEGPDHAGFMTNWRELAGAFAATRWAGPGTLAVARPDSTVRQILCRYSSGFEESGDDGTAVRADTAVLTLRAGSPWWTATKPLQIIRRYAPTGRDFLAPFPTVSSSQTLGDTTLDNPGQVGSVPNWTISGPATLITMTSRTLGRSWTLDPTVVLGRPLAAGEVVTVSGDPVQVTGPADDEGNPLNWLPAIDWLDSDLWAIVPGVNDVSFNVTDSGTGTSVTAVFYPRYETA